MAKLKGGSRVYGNLQIDGALLDTSGDAGTSGQILSSTVTGTNWIANSAISEVTTQIFTSGTSATYTAPANLKYAMVIATGGGGGGGGADTSGGTGVGGGGGGGAGGTVIRVYSAAEMGATAVYTVGGGGASGSTSGGNGGTGTDTVFNPGGTGATITATGGSAGTGTGQPSSLANAAYAGGDGATPTGTLQINIPGGSGVDGYGVGVGATFAIGGAGGGSFWGGSGNAGVRVTTGGSSAAGSVGAFGAGGAGAAVVNTTTGAAGAAGEAGVIYVIEYS